MMEKVKAFVRLFKWHADPHRDCTDQFCFAEPPFCHYARLVPEWRKS
jgi:hypothetical protein